MDNHFVLRQGNSIFNSRGLQVVALATTLQDQQFDGSMGKNIVKGRHEWRQAFRFLSDDIAKQKHSFTTLHTPGPWHAQYSGPFSLRHFPGNSSVRSGIKTHSRHLLTKTTFLIPDTLSKENKMSLTRPQHWYHTWQFLRNHSLWPWQTFLFCFLFKGTHSRRQVQFLDIMATRHLMGPFPLFLASHHIIYHPWHSIAIRCLTCIQSCLISTHNHTSYQSSTHIHIRLRTAAQTC